jgi:hypothetical protein
METKLFEVRDRATLIPVIAIRLGGDNESERYLLARVGYGRTSEEQQDYILYAGLEYFDMQSDPYKQTNRTRHESHKYIHEHWDELSSGDVIDVEFILGETDVKKESEAHA